jgi:hypothetical protein
MESLLFTDWLADLKDRLAVDYPGLRVTDLSAETVQHWFNDGYTPEQALREGLGGSEGATVRKGERKATEATLTDTWMLIVAMQHQLSVLAAWHRDNRHLQNISEDLTRFAESLQIGEKDLKTGDLLGGADTGDAGRSSPRREQG